MYFTQRTLSDNFTNSSCLNSVLDVQRDRDLVFQVPVPYVTGDTRLKTEIVVGVGGERRL